MIKNRNYYPRNKVFVWYEDEGAELGATCAMVDEFETASEARKLFDSINFGDDFEDNKVLGVRFEVEYKSDTLCFAEKDELAEHIYYEE